MPKASRELRLQMLGNGATELQKELEACFGYSAGVCLEDQGHTQGVALSVSGFRNTSFALYWEPVTDQMKRSWQDEQKATEFGAVGVALLLIREMTDQKAFEVSRKNNGFDYWMTDRDEMEPFKKAARLEVTGIRHGTESQKSARLREKLDRLGQYQETLPAFIVVVEFSQPGSMVERK